MRVQPRRDEGISAVVGTILLFVIVVAMAAAVAVVWTKMADRHVNRPHTDVAFTFQDGPRTATVVTVAADLDWFEHFRSTGSCSPTLNGAAFPTAPGTAVQANDVLGCGPGQTLTLVATYGGGESLLVNHAFP